MSKSLMELDTGQDILLIPSSNSSFTSLPIQRNLEDKSTEDDEEETIPEEIEEKDVDEQALKPGDEFIFQLPCEIKEKDADEEALKPGDEFIFQLPCENATSEIEEKDADEEAFKPGDVFIFQLPCEDGTSEKEENLELQESEISHTVQSESVETEEQGESAKSSENTPSEPNPLSPPPSIEKEVIDLQNDDKIENVEASSGALPGSVMQVQDLSLFKNEINANADPTSYITSKFKVTAFINQQNLIKPLSCKVIDISSVLFSLAPTPNNLQLRDFFDVTIACEDEQTQAHIFGSPPRVSKPVAAEPRDAPVYQSSVVPSNHTVTTPVAEPQLEQNHHVVQQDHTTEQYREEGVMGKYEEYGHFCDPPDKGMVQLDSDEICTALLNLLPPAVNARACEVLHHVPDVSHYAAGVVPAKLNPLLFHIQFPHLPPPQVYLGPADSAPT